MDVEGLVQLIGSGNVRTVEDAWLSALTEETASAQGWMTRVAVLEALVATGKQAEAAELAATALESLRERVAPADLVPLAGAMLLAVGEAPDVRDAVLELYQAAFADRPNLPGLLEASGLAGEKTPRRALRTLEVCLALSPGDFLIGRHDDSAARVDAVEPGTWRFSVATSKGSRTLDPTALADAYAPTAADDYRVLAQFDRERLAALLEKDPAPIVRTIVRAHGDRMTGDDLEVLLTRGLVPPDQWTKWWSRARSALKKSADVTVEGRNPYIIQYDPNADSLEQQTRASLARIHDSAGSLKALQTYLREARARGTSPDADLLRHMAATLDARARRQQEIGNRLALETWLIAARVREALGDPEPDAPAVALLAAADNPEDWIRAIEINDLWDDGCACLEKARPEGIAARLADLLRTAPTAVCDDIAERLVRLSFPPEEFDELVQEIIAEPMGFHGALFWLWQGPRRADIVRSVTVPELLHRTLVMLTEMKRNDKLDRRIVKAVRAGARSALSNRKYERVRACIEGMDLSMARAVYAQVRRLEELGRAVQEDILKIIGDAFPAIFAREKIEPWADARVMYVTSAGLAAKEAEIRDLVNVKMKENARAIGAAAEHGDLSENSEYKFALEERDLLRARLAQMNEQMAMARILEPEDVPSDRVGIGSRVVLRNTETGATRELVILSAWEADTARGIVNYKAPLAQAVLGRRTGDTVELQLADGLGAFVVESISNVLRSAGGAPG